MHSMNKLELQDFIEGTIPYYCIKPDIPIPLEKFSWKPVGGFWVENTLAHYKSWLDENNIMFLYLYGGIVFKTEEEALLFKLRWF